MDTYITGKTIKNLREKKGLTQIELSKVQFIKLYPQSKAETRLQLRGGGYLYIYCNKHGLMKMKL